MSAYVTKPTSACERVSRALSVLLSELHFPTRALGPITEARDLLLRAALDANEFYATERDELVRDVVKLRTDLATAVARAEQAEARLAAIESAPTVAMFCPLTESAFNESTLMTAYQKAKMPHVELIARPAKD